MSHLTPGEIVDALGGALPAARQTHARECDACARDVAALRRLLAETRRVAVPEPSALFWDRFSDRVRAAIAAEPVERPRHPWFAWPVLAPIASLALVLLALGAAISRDRVTIAPAANTTAAAAVEDGADTPTMEAVWALASDLVSADADVPESELAIAPGSAERAVVYLSTDEQQELMRLIQEELGKSGG
jgi:hypothetical protein